MPKELLPGTQNKGNQGIKIRESYNTANNSKIPVYGRKTIEGMTDDWSPVVVQAEVANVRRCLGSVIRICEAGNVVQMMMATPFGSPWVTWRFTI